jgi:hypothetical protein
MVVGGHVTEVLSVMTYASVVSRESVRITLTIAALNNLQVKASDIMNAYLTSPREENIWTVLGTEFGRTKSYTSPSSVWAEECWGVILATSSRLHANVGLHIMQGRLGCLKVMIRPEDRLWYYAYILLYVDDILCIHHDAESAINELDRYHRSIGDPDIYLGTKLHKVELSNGVHAWSMSLSKYVQDAVHNVEEHLRKNGDCKLPGHCSAPWPSDYVCETDTSTELTPQQANYYQSLIGVLHWMVEIEHVDMITKVSKLASHMALLRKGHMDTVYHIFGWLKRKYGS